MGFGIPSPYQLFKTDTESPLSFGFIPSSHLEIAIFRKIKIEHINKKRNQKNDHIIKKKKKNFCDYICQIVLPKISQNSDFYNSDFFRSVIFRKIVTI